MEVQEILSRADHTLLKQEATWPQIRQLCDEGMKYHTASVCIPASYVKQAAAYLGGRLPVCTVIGFPNGYSTTRTKAFEAGDAIANGADEIDMVINLGWVKDSRWAELLAELKEVRSVCQGKVLKVIVETCLLTREEKIQLCHLVSQAGADYIKTSTGFSTGGATPEDVTLFRENIAPNVKIKAAGGITTLADAEELICCGANRLGTSRIVKLVREMEEAR
ncbi:MAG: deoxyribose-phosphate aldolase [Oscillospiraceae bacterium]|nr:deoxyribose-phosphate aldolase [Oscillospiraceae bacterium]